MAYCIVPRIFRNDPSVWQREVLREKGRKTNFKKGNEGEEKEVGGKKSGKSFEGKRNERNGEIKKCTFSRTLFFTLSLYPTRTFLNSLSHTHFNHVPRRISGKET